MLHYQIFLVIDSEGWEGYSRIFSDRWLYGIPYCETRVADWRCGEFLIYREESHFEAVSWPKILVISYCNLSSDSK
jgi:hypothetical protein